MFRRYLVPFKAHRLPHVLTDALVIGGGVAGLRAALAAANCGEQEGRRGDCEVLLLSKTELKESNTYYAQGGIATVMTQQGVEGGGDSFESHIDDTMTVACGLGNLPAVEAVVRDAPSRIEELVACGANFDRAADGSLAVGREGGHSFARIIHALGDATGRELANSLMHAVLKHPNIQTMEHTFVLDLITIDGACAGAIAWQKDRGLFMILARKTLLASGGAGMLYRETTNPPVATADGHAMAFRAGAVTRDMEMVQFHPTTIYIAGATRALVSEAVRGEGAKLIDKNGYRFMPDYHPQAELAPRDVVSRAMLAQMAKTKYTHVFLDARHMSEAAFQERFPGIYQMCVSFDVNPAKQPIPVHPSAHYMVGGAVTNLSGLTSIRNLYAIGEVSNTGLHGANRLASNSLIEALVFGKRAGEHAGQLIAGGDGEASEDLIPPKLSVEIESSSRTELDMADVRSSLRSLMWRNVGIERNGPRLEEATEIIHFWSRYVLDKTFDSPAGWELQNMLQVASLIARAATLRTETRGVHYRTDHPASDNANWQVHIDWQTHRNAPTLTPTAK
ncbi:MAG: L-aspartate oxidase [Phycisphaerales bacterium]|nr:L-aspartate oxidase [Phycisphaerales bacterium]